MGDASTTESTQTAPSWFRWIVPSVTDLVFLLPLIVFCLGPLPSRLLGDAGIGWHIRTGELILRTRAMIRTDPFSAGGRGRAWYAWEWLFDVGAGWIHGWSGLNGIVFFAALGIALTFALVFRCALKRGATVPAAMTLLVVAMGASAIHFFARPHVWSWLFTVLWFEVLDSSEDTGARRLFWLPLIMLVWVNVHGGFVIGFVLLGLYFVSGVARYYWCRDVAVRSGIGNWLRRLATSAAFVALASFANPYGYHLHAHIYGYLTDRFLMNHIDEFRSPNFHNAAPLCFAALLLITLAVLAAARGKLRLSQWLVLLFAVYSGLYASRSLPVSSLLLVMIVAPLLAQAMASGGVSEIASGLRGRLARFDGFSQRMTRMEMDLRGHLWPALVVGAGLIVCLHRGALGSSQIMDARFDLKKFPVQAVDVIAQRGIHQPIFGPDYWGGYLIYRLYPATKVVVDDRHDFYGDDFLRDYVKLINVEPGWQKVLDERSVNYVLYPAKSSLSNLLRESTQWKVGYEDDVAVLFERSAAGSDGK